MADGESHSRLQDINTNHLSAVMKPIKGFIRNSRDFLSPSSRGDPGSSRRQIPKFLKSKVKSREGEPIDRTGTFDDTTASNRAAESSARSSNKDNLFVTLRFLRTLAKNSSQIVDSNPAKIALGLVKLIIEISRTMKDNKDTLSIQIASTGAKLKEVERALEDWKPRNEDAIPWMDDFRTALTEQLQGLKCLEDESGLRKFLDHEDEQGRIKSIFIRIDEARVRFELAMGLRIFRATYEINRDIRTVILKHLEPSDIAHHDYILEGAEGKVLRRQVCTPGTRVNILDNIITWAKDASSDSPTVYWLFGHAGSGKSTIAYTIARRFEFAGDPTDTIILGGNFMCSRQFEKTRLSKYIVRTIVYHLALKCRPFADALIRSGRLDTISQNLRTQLHGLLFGPWLESKEVREADPSTLPRYLIVIDALDEIDGTGGSDFLRDLVNTINQSSVDCLSGLKFFITSRSDPGLVTHVESLERKQLYRLQDVEESEARADVGTYLNASLPFFKGREEMGQLVEQAGGLFIYAATVIKLLKGLPPLDQKRTLKMLLSSNDANPSQSSFQDPEALLNKLYSEILMNALGGLEAAQLRDRLWILFTLLCAREPLSVTVITRLLFKDDPEERKPEFSYIIIASEVLERLHAVLYVEHGLIFTYHKSFPDFIFDRQRSGMFWCNKAEHHRLLTIASFNVMDELKFNIANIETSFVLDKDNDKLANEVEQNIPPDLSYSCRNWDYHLSGVQRIPSDPLIETLSEFLKIRALFWIEAMNLLSYCGRCYPMLRAAHDWAESALASNLAEAASFTLYLSGTGASLSTPHLYISALATWHGKADVCQGWKSYFPWLPNFRNGQTGGALMSMNVKSEVNAVSFSPDGSRIASGSQDNSVRIWDALTGKEIFELKGHNHFVASVAFSTNGCHIVSGSGDKTIRIWDASTSKEIRLLEGHANVISSVVFSSDGSRIVSGSGDKTIRIWDASTGKEIHILEGHTNGVNSVAYSRDGSRIVSGSDDLSIRIWDALTGKEISLLEGPRGPIHSVAFSSDGSRIVSGSDDLSIRIWDALTGKEIRLLEGHISAILSVAFSSDGGRIVSGSSDKLIRVWDASTCKEIRILEGHTTTVKSVAFSSDGGRVVSGSRDKTIRIWDASAGEVVDTLEGHTDGVNSVAYSSEGSRIVSGSSDQSIRIWDAFTGNRIHVLEGHTSSVESVAFSSDGGRIVSGSDDKSIRIWDASTGEEVQVLVGHTDLIKSVAFSSDGSHIVSASYDKSVRIWDASAGKGVRKLDGHTDRVNSVAYSSDDSRIVSGSDDLSIRIWDPSTGAEIRLLEGHTSAIHSVAFSSDGSRIVSGSSDDSILIWDTSTNKVIHVLEGHTKQVTSVAFSSDGSRIVSSSLDKTIRIWDVLTGGQLHVLRGHIFRVKSVAFSKDGSRIVSGSEGKSLRVWDTSILHETPRYIREKAGTSDDDTYTGWLLTQKGYLMFVPPDKNLPDDSNILTIPYGYVRHVDFTHAALGPEWTQCYSP